MTMRVMLDGWSLCYAPNSAAALHLLDLLQIISEEYQPLLALPGDLDEVSELPEYVDIHLLPTRHTPGAHLLWEQRTLPRLARRQSADLLHLVTYSVALAGGPPTLVSPCGFTQDEQRLTAGLADRLRRALSVGTLGQAQAILWPADLPQPDLPALYKPLPPLVSPDFNPTDPPDLAALEPYHLPESYVLYHGPQDPASITRLLDVWSWAAGAVGELYPLVVLGMEKQGRQQLLEVSADTKLNQTLIRLPAVSLPAIAALYRGAAALLHIGDVSPWGGPLRYALACGVPVVAAYSSDADALVGPAGYLVGSDDARAMGAALLSVLVNEEVAQPLRQAALVRAAGWRMAEFGQQLFGVYRQLIGLNRA
jgi:glycosyltransferase involved in cell wall biosynthesis